MADASSLKQHVPPESKPDFLEHLRSLHLSTAEEYRDWCASNGFSRRILKSWRERLKERSFCSQAIAKARLAQKRLECRKPEAVIKAIFSGELSEADVTQPHLHAICHAFRQAVVSDWVRRAFLDLLLHADRTSDLISIEPVVSQYGRQEANTFISGLLALAKLSAHWIRPVSTWKPRSHNPRRQFSSLAQHLFASWPVPAFMESAWFQCDARKASYEQAWYLHLGKGENIRTAELPLPYTKRMAHFFMRAPSDFSVDAALRWGQIHSLGGNERLVRALLGTRLIEDYEHDDFWVTVIRFFIANPMLDTAEFGPIIDYVFHQKYETQERVGTDGQVERIPPLQANFSMKGRTPEALLRQVEAWHAALPKTKVPQAEWPASNIAPLRFVEGSVESGNQQTWTTTELLSTKALVEEGRRMCHCVATYARSCSYGQSSIWTLEVRSQEGLRKVLTIEVHRAGKLICQAKGKRNASPGEKHQNLLHRWAAQAGLTVAPWV